MRLREILTGCAALLWLQSGAQAQHGPGRVESTLVARPTPHPEAELARDQPADPATWAHVAPGLHAAFASTDDVYLRVEVPRLDDGRGWSAAGWRGERLNGLAVVWSSGALEQVRIQVGDLADEAGHVLPAAGVRVRLVRYVLSDHPPGARDTTCDAGPAGTWLVPDRLEPYDAFDLPARSVRPVWISIDVPPAAAPGRYTGHLRVSSGSHRVSLPLTISVKHPVVPPPRNWAFRLDLWQNPWAVAWHHRVAPWSEEHKALLRRHLALYADAGGGYVTTYAVHSPWQDNSYWIEGGMIEWIREPHGGWRFDYRIFDEYVALAMDAGVTRAITIYTPVPWGHRFRYVDASTGAHVTAAWPPTSAEYREAWHAFLDDLRHHLAARGWLERTYLGINEIDMPATRAAIDVIRSHAKSWRITYAGDWHADLEAAIDDYSSVHGKEPTPEQVRRRAARGASTTFYVCCTPPAPNTFVFSPPAEGRWLGWYAAARGYDGFLRWAYDAWPADPSRDARHVLWPAGDTFLVYPGGESSVRFETLREGIVDFEKLRRTRQLAARATDPRVRSRLAALDEVLAVIADGRPPSDAQMRAILERARTAVEELADVVEARESRGR